MKFATLTWALAASAFGSVMASAQTTIIEERRPGVVVQQREPVVVERPPVVVQQRPVVVERPPVIVQQPQVVVVPAPTSTVTTQERGGFLGTESRTTTTTTGTGPDGDCATRTVHRQDLLGEKTVSRTDCP